MRALEKRAEAGDRQAKAELAGAWMRLGRGWHGEELPDGIAADPGEPFVYLRALGRETTQLVRVRGRGGRSFFVGRFPVTWDELDEYLRTLPGNVVDAHERFRARPLAPVALAWEAADAFARWAGFSLPSATEWELAAGWDECPRCGGTGAIVTDLLGDDEEDCGACGGRGANGPAWPWGHLPPPTDDHADIFGDRGVVALPTSGRLEPTHPLGASKWGVLDLIRPDGEWTTTVAAGGSRVVMGGIPDKAGAPVQTRWGDLDLGPVARGILARELRGAADGRLAGVRLVWRPA